LTDGGHPAPSHSPDGAIFMAAMRLEALAVGGKVLRTGMGHGRAHAAAEMLARRIEPGAAVVLAGISGGLDPTLTPGEIVVATSVRGPDGDELALSAADADAVATALRGAGRRVHLGPIVSSKTLVHGERRAELARTGALAVDMESAWVARALSSHRLVIVRLVADTAGNFVVGLVKGLVALRHVRGAVDRWPGMPTPGAN
jgi:4-hydroxy-3-methylbut-2-enyl diphosphate reductase